jgi:integrase
VYRLRVYAGTDPVTGRPRQASKTVRARTETIAKRELRAFAVEVQARHGAIPTSVTVKGLLGRWVEEFLPGSGKAKTTVESYRLVVNKHLVPALGAVQLRDLTAYHLDRYYRGQQAAGMAPRTVRQHHAILSSALSQAVKWRWLDRSPAGSATPPALPRGQGAIPGPDEVRRLIDKCGDDIDLAAVVTVAAITGLRRGELCGLRWSDVDWDGGLLAVERQRVAVAGGYETLPLKHGDGRRVAIGELGLAVLDRYRQAVDGRCGRLGVARMVDGWLFSADGGRSPTGPKWLSDQISSLGRRAGVDVTPHALRRFAATQMVGAGVDVRTAAGRLGHTPEVMLRRYAGFMPARDLEAARGLERLVLPSPSGANSSAMDADPALGEPSDGQMVDDGGHRLSEPVEHPKDDRLLFGCGQRRPTGRVHGGDVGL